jgi:hypothetical protein
MARRSMDCYADRADDPQAALALPIEVAEERLPGARRVETETDERHDRRVAEKRVHLNPSEGCGAA